MTGVWMMLLLLPIITAQRASPCPASCVVCSEDAVICQRLAHIIDAPDSTQALLLTEGFISSVHPSSLSDLSNITVIGLSNNRISELGEESFKKLPFLHTLLLDHNLLTSQTLQGGALINLTQLEVLALGHNLISMIQAGWFRGIKALRSLKLEGNLLTSLDSGSFPLNDLRDLETLDLSDNLIQHMDKNSFRGLVSLKTLDLSRNRLSSAPAEDFSYLTLLTNLNLDLNLWNCSCQLLDLAAFLSTFMQQPDKTLYNGRRMVCVSADNPAVSTVLELTDANCVPSNQNITVQVETRGSVTPQLYARDLAIAAVVCFIGGVGLTLLVVLIYYQVSRRKKRKQNQRLKEEEEGSSTVANHINHLDAAEGRRDVFLQANRETMMLDARNDVGQFRSRADENSGYLKCANCSNNWSRMNPMRRDNRTNGGMEAEEDRERRRARMMMMEEERRRTGFQQGILNRDAPNKFPPRGNTNSSSNPQRETFGQRTENMPPYKTGRDVDNHRADVEAKSRGFESLHCESCHRTYRPPDQNTRQGRIQPNPRDSAAFDGFPPQHRQTDRGRNVSHQYDMMMNAESRRETRNVTFDLERTVEQGSGRVEGKTNGKTSGDREKEKERRHKVQSSRLLKVKLNLNPLRKSKVHPKRRSEQRHSEKSSPKKSKEKRRDGKEREEKEGKGKKAKSGSKSSKTKGSTKDGEEGGGQKDKTSKQKKATSRSEQDDQERTETDVNKQPENVQPADSTDAPSSTAVTGQPQNLQSVQYQAVGVAQLPSQLPFSLLAADRSRTTSLSLLGSAGSQLTGSSVSLQGGNFLLSNSNMSSGSNALFPSSPGASVAPGINLSGPSVAPGVAPVMSSGPPFLANAGHTNPLQASSVHATTPAANPSVNPVQSVSQIQMPPDSSPLAARLQPDPAPGPARPHQLPAESQPPSTKDCLPVQGEDEPSTVTPLNLEPATTVENVSNNNSQIRTLSGTLSGVPAEGAAVEASGVASTTSTQSGSSTAAAAVLLQQEYLSEEGGSSPRRKLRLVIPEKTSSRPPTALERKIR